MRLLIAMLTAAALAVAGCGSSYSSGGSSKTSGGGSSSSSSAPSAYGGGSSSKSSSAGSGSGTIQVTMQNIAFNPATIHAKVGQTIKWTNRDSVAHNVTAQKGESFHSPTLNQGQSYSYKLDHAGTITYVCTFHPGMQATVVVSK